jgi:hypothetical protein
MLNSQELKAGLDQHFGGTDQWYRHGLNRSMLYTDGVRFFAEHAGHGAYWFLDIVATELMQIHRYEPFIVVRVKVDGDRKALLIADDGNGKRVWQRRLDYTDAPEGTWEFYLEDNVLYLPCER